MTAADDVLLDIPVVELTHAGARQLESLARDDRTAWYRRARRDALWAAGIISAGYNPMQPRGRDGRWIELLGWVRWLQDGKWHRGRVTAIDPGTGSTIVTDSVTGEKRGFTKLAAREKLYTVAKTKAVLTLPKPGSQEGAPGFTKIGPQAGSNPGALYEVTDSSAVEGNLEVTPEMIHQTVRAQGAGASDAPPGTALTVPLKHEKLDVNMTDEAATVLGKTGGTNSIVIDDRNNKAYWKLSDSVLWDMTTGKAVDPVDVFGAPNSAKRADIADDISMYNGSAAEVSKVFSEAKALGVGRPQKDTRFYVKTAKSPTHAKNEALANHLYEMGGVPVPNVSVGRDGETIASEIVSSSQDPPDVVKLADAIKDPETASVIRQNFVFDAWLANWDVTGTGLDNMLVVDGVPYRIDSGGAMLFRAQGGPKGNKFSNEVTELDTMRTSTWGAPVFHAVSEAEILMGGERLAAISPQEIIDAVEAHGLEKSLADKLIARRKYILDRYDIPEPDPIDAKSLTVGPAGDAETIDAAESLAETPKMYPLNISGMYWNPKMKNFVAGKAATTDAWAEHEGYVAADVSPMSMTSIAYGYENGHDVLVAHNGNLWKVNDVVPSGPDGYTLTMQHPVSGETTTIEGTSSTTYPATTDDEGFIVQDYSPLWGAYQEFAANEYTSVLDIVQNKNGNDVGTTALKPTDALKPGQWLIMAAPGDFNPQAYRVVSTTQNPVDGTLAEIRIADMDGVETNIGYSYDFRRASPGSHVDAALDAIQARHDVAKKQDELAKATLSSTAYDAPTVGDSKMQTLAASKPDAAVDVASVEAGDEEAESYFDPETQINKSLKAIGDPMPIQSFTSMSAEDRQAWVGKKVYMRLVDQPQKSYSGYQPPRDRGVFEITGFSAAGSPLLKDAQGRPRSANAYQALEVFEIEGAIAPVTSFQLKQDNTVGVNGEIVGKWGGSPYSYSPQWTITIDPQFTVSGKEFKQKVKQKAGMREVAIPMLMPPGSGGAKPKSNAAISLEKAVRAEVQFGHASNEVTEGGAAATLLDGSKVEVGMWVISKTDGKVGQVSLIEANTGYVKVKMADGTVKGRAASTLSAAADPSSKSIPPASPLYAGVKLSDGSQPYPSQTVSTATGDVTIVMIKPDGNVRVAHPDGKFTWTKAAKLTPAKSDPTATAQLADSPGAKVAVLDEAWKTAPKLPPSKVAYAAPDGSTIVQATDAVEQYRRYAPQRKLTRDNFVPFVGMRVRDDKGDQLVITKIAETYAGNPSTVWVMPAGAAGAKPIARQPSRLWVDHVAELATADGKPLPKVSGFHLTATNAGESLPTGSIVYSYDSKQWVAGRYVNTRSYFAALPDGTAREFSAQSINVESPAWRFETIFKTAGGVHKVAYVDETADATMTIEHIDSGSTWTPPYVGDVWIHSSEEGALEALKEEVAKKKLAAGVIEPEKFAGSSAHLITLPKPSSAGGDMTKPNPPPPIVKADPKRLQGASVVGSSYTIESGIAKLREQAAAGGPGSQTLYVMGDTDKIEDMSMRLQTAVDQNGDEFVEMRFRLLEDSVDDLASRLIINNSTKVGAWRQSTQTNPKDLVVGDVLTVRIGSGGVLKPVSSNEPNASVVAPPRKVGVTANGFDAYEVDVAVASGTPATLVLEQRPLPSIQLYEWDPLKPVSHGSFNGVLDPDAAKMGWTVRNTNGVGYESHGSKTMIDAKGRKSFDSTSTDWLAVASLNGAMRLQFDAGDDSRLSVQVVHPDAETRLPTIPSNGDNRGRRSSANGDVVIRVRADDPNALEKVSTLLSAAGIPPEVQRQPTARDIRKMALIKVYKQLAPTYQHGKRPDVTGDDDASAAAVLKLIDDRFGTQLGRPATMDDIMIRTTPEGRIQVVFSDDVARAIVKRAGWTHGYHHFSSGGFHDRQFTSLTGTGLMSTDERWSQGIITSGASSKADIGNDAGNRVYFRLSNNKGNFTGSGRMVISAMAIAKQVDTYWNSGDRYGRRTSKNGQMYEVGYFGGGDELMIKRKIDPEMYGYVVVSSESVRDSVIKELKAKGVTEISGRPVEDVIVASGTKGPDDLGEQGGSFGVEVPITSIIGAPEEEAGAAPATTTPTVVV